LHEAVGDTFAVDGVVCCGTKVEEWIKSAIWDNSSYVAYSDTTLEVCRRKIFIRLWAPDGTAVAFGQ
jgi:hypothetical protein